MEKRRCLVTHWTHRPGRIIVTQKESSSAGQRSKLMTIWPRWFVGVALVVLLGCDMPRDPEGTLNRVRGGVLRVGISHNPPWTEVPPGTEMADEEPGGLEPQLLKQLAAALSAEIQWTKDTEGDLIEALGRGDLDVVVCGM